MTLGTAFGYSCLCVRYFHSPFSGLSISVGGSYCSLGHHCSSCLISPSGWPLGFEVDNHIVSAGAELFSAVFLASSFLCSGPWVWLKLDCWL